MSAWCQTNLRSGKYKVRLWNVKTIPLFCWCLLSTLAKCLNCSRQGLQSDCCSELHISGGCSRASRWPGKSHLQNSLYHYPSHLQNHSRHTRKPPGFILKPLSVEKTAEILESHAAKPPKLKNPVDLKCRDISQTNTK